LVESANLKDPNVSEKRILSALDLLKDKGQIDLKPPKFGSFRCFILDSSWNIDFWIVLIVVVASSLSYLLTDGYPWNLLGILPGVLLIFYLPGHSFLRIFLSRENVQPLERIVLEIGSSIVLVFLLGLLLNFSRLGLLSAAALLSLIAFNVLLALWASYRDYSTAHRG
jgi:uncharacterized membrane protein